MSNTELTIGNPRGIKTVGSDTAIQTVAGVAPSECGSSLPLSSELSKNGRIWLYSQSGSKLPHSESAPRALKPCGIGRPPHHCLNRSVLIALGFLLVSGRL